MVGHTSIIPPGVSVLVDHRASQVETLFGELEYIEPRLKALGIIETNGVMSYVADEETDNA